MLKLLKLWQLEGNRMDMHKNARLTPAALEIMVRPVVEGGQTPKALGAAVGVCPRTVQKWVKRFRAEGLAGLQDRSSRPHRLRCATPPETVARIEALRRWRWTGAQIARETGVSKPTVSRILHRIGLNRLKALEECADGAPGGLDRTRIGIAQQGLELDEHLLGR
jgi:transposase